jgi:tetratricopeptide (TPR) repeat protein
MITAPRVRLVRPRLIGIVLATAVLVVGSYVVTWVTRPPAPTVHETGAAASAPAVSLQPAEAPAAGRDERLLARFDGAIDAWNLNVTSNAGDYISATNLGTTYVGRARLTGDLADYERAMTAANRALRINGTYLPARGLRATVLFALHDFRGALDEAEATRVQDPANLQAMATIGDASLELGDVDAARIAYAELERTAPSAPIFSRLAHLAFVEGDPDRAISLVRQAVAAVATETPSETTAFYSFQLGELLRARGDVARAAQAYERALDDLPTYVPAMAGLARVREAQGRRAEAIALLKAATARLPQPDLVSALGDLYALSGDSAAAERQYALVERIGQVGSATGSVYDRQLVLFAADHDRRVAHAVVRARAELEVRRDIYGHDALAWALFKAGKLGEAATEAGAAMTLGTQDPRIAYHAGMIAAATGRTDEARRLLTAALSGAAYLPPLQVPALEAALAALPHMEPAR